MRSFGSTFLPERVTGSAENATMGLTVCAEGVARQGAIRRRETVTDIEVGTATGRNPRAVEPADSLEAVTVV